MNGGYRADVFIVESVTLCHTRNQKNVSTRAQLKDLLHYEILRHRPLYILVMLDALCV